MKIYFTYPKSIQKIKIIGIEPFKNGVTNIADFCIKNNLKNIFYTHKYFINLLKNLKIITLINVIFFFPDPWPKKKHHKRRLVNFDFLNSLIFLPS